MKKKLSEFQKKELNLDVSKDWEVTSKHFDVSGTFDGVKTIFVKFNNGKDTIMKAYGLIGDYQELGNKREEETINLYQKARRNLDTLK